MWNLIVWSFEMTWNWFCFFLSTVPCASLLLIHSTQFITHFPLTSFHFRSNFTGDRHKYTSAQIVSWIFFKGTWKFASGVCDTDERRWWQNIHLCVLFIHFFRSFVRSLWTFAFKLLFLSLLPSLTQLPSYVVLGQSDKTSIQIYLLYVCSCDFLVSITSTDVVAITFFHIFLVLSFCMSDKILERDEKEK